MERELLEREDVLDRMLETAERLKHGGGQIVLVEGPAGIGKTSLLEAFVARVPARHHRARGIEFETAIPFGVTRQLLERAVADLPEVVRGKVTAGAAALSRPAVSTAVDEPPPQLQTVKAVEKHLAGAFTKLGIDSRRRLAAVLSER